MPGEVAELTEVQDPSTLDDAKLEEAIAAATKEVEGEADTGEKSDKAAEEKVEVKPEAEGKKEGDPADKGKEPTEEEKIAKQKADKEAFIARQKEEKDRLEKEIQANANRIGEMRKRAAQLRDEAKDATDTVEAIEKMDSARTLEAMAKETEDDGTIAITRQAVTSIHPEFDTLMPEMQDIVRGHLTALGKPEGDVSAIVGEFAKNPYAIPPAVLSNLAEAAKARLEAKTAKADLVKAREEIGSLKKKGDDAFKKVAKAADNPSILSGKTAGTRTGKPDMSDLSAVQIAQLSNEQLDALLAEQLKNE